MYGGYGYYGLGYSLFDPTMILVYIGALLSLWASSKVNSTFQRYSRVRSMTGMTGAEAAKRLLQSQGIYDVTVRPVRGQLTDHYDPRTKTVNLSESFTAAHPSQPLAWQPMSVVMLFRTMWGMRRCACVPLLCRSQTLAAKFPCPSSSWAFLSD